MVQNRWSNEQIRKKNVKNKFYGLIQKYKTLEQGHTITKSKLKYERRLLYLKGQTIDEDFDLQNEIFTPYDCNYFMFKQPISNSTIERRSMMISHHISKKQFNHQVQKNKYPSNISSELTIILNCFQKNKLLNKINQNNTQQFWC
ncbi:hypothetical protein pb186bvf_009735 [Paramecium bursaria]